MNFYNLQQLIKISIKGFQKSNYYEYRESKRRWFRKSSPEGIWRTYIYEGHIYEGYIGKSLKNHTVLNGIVYENPKVILYFNNDHTVDKSFKTLEEALNFGNKIIKDIKDSWKSL